MNKICEVLDKADAAYVNDSAGSDTAVKKILSILDISETDTDTIVCETLNKMSISDDSLTFQRTNNAMGYDVFSLKGTRLPVVNKEQMRTSDALLHTLIEQIDARARESTDPSLTPLMDNISWQDKQWSGVVMDIGNDLFNVQPCKRFECYLEGKDRMTPEVLAMPKVLSIKRALNAKCTASTCRYKDCVDNPEHFEDCSRGLVFMCRAQVKFIMYFAEVVLNHQQFVNCLDVLYASLFTTVDMPCANGVTHEAGHTDSSACDSNIEVDVKPVAAQLCIFCMCALNRYVEVRGRQGSVVHQGVQKDDVSRSFSILADTRYAVYTKSQTDYKANDISIKTQTNAQLVHVSDRSQYTVCRDPLSVLAFPIVRKNSH